MMQKNLLIKTIFSFILLTTILHGSAQPTAYNANQTPSSTTSSPAMGPGMPSALKPPTDSPQSCPIEYINPTADQFRAIFSAENLRTLRPDQNPESLLQYITRETYQALAAHDQRAQGNIIAACLRFLAGDEVWLKSLAVSPENDEKTIHAALRSLTKALKRENPGHPLICNIVTSADPLNAAIHKAMQTSGWKPAHQFHKLEKSTDPTSISPAKSSPLVNLGFNTTRTIINPAFLKKTRQDAYDTLTNPKTLPFFDCSREEVKRYLQHPLYTTIVAYVLEQKRYPRPAGAVVYSLPKEGHGKIDFIGVHPSFRKKGVARTLLRFVQDQLRDAHAVHTVEINVLGSNERARKCYENSGFIVTSSWSKLRASSTVTPQPEQVPPLSLPPSAITL